MNQLRRYTALAGAVLMVLAAACTTKEQGIAVTGVTLNPPTLTLGIGESKTLTAEVQPSDATNKTISWSTDDPSMNVIALSGNTVKGIAEGSATVTVTTADGNRTAKCKVTVSKNGSSENPNPGTEDEVPVAGVSVSPASLSLTVGDEASLSAAYTPANATLKGQWAWSVDNPSVASIQFAGGNATIKALAAGSATVTASLDGKSATASITVSAVAVQVPDGTVDLGLPSGIFWCTENLGQTYKWDDYGSAAKYTPTDNLSLLEAADDRATQALGENYRTPTLGDWVELNTYCTCEKTTDPSGFLFTSKINGKTLFLQLATYWSSTLERVDENKDGTFPYAYTLRAEYISKPELSSQKRSYTETIRPVYAKRPVIATGITVPQEKYELGRGESIKLTASVQPSSASQQVYWDYGAVDFNYETREAVLRGFGNVVGRVRAIDGTNGYSSAAIYLYPKFPKEPAEAVDLGLPSGTKWASYDLGASAPEEPGFYFAWGETELKYDFRTITYKWYDTQTEKYTKYDIENRFLETQDDAAAVHWGGKWQMPTRAQVEELINKTTMEETTLNGVKGYKVTGPNLNTIFLPFGGCITGSSVSASSENYFYYATCELDSWGNVSLLCCSPYTKSVSREYGCCIRPVQPKQ